MRHLRALARAAIMVCGLGSCQRADPEALYISGDFLEARKYYNAEKCAKAGGDAATRCRERAAQIEEALVGAAQFLGRRANERVRYGKQIQFNQYDEAVRSLELALRILPPEHASRADFQAGVERIHATQSALRGELDEQLTKLRAMLETGTYDPEVWTEIRLTFERVRVLVLAIGQPDDRPRRLASELMQKFRNHGQYEHARIAGEISEAMDAPGTGRPAHTDNELVIMGVIDAMAQRQEADRRAKIQGLAREAASAFAAKKGVLAATKAHAALELGPSPSTARQMRAIIEQTEGTVGQDVRAKAARQVVAEAKTDIAPVPVAKTASLAIADDEGASQPAPKVEEAPVDRRPPAQRLAEILRHYERKQLYEALSGIELLHREALPKTERRKVNELRRLWTPDRKRLINELVAKADQLYVVMDENSLTEYQRAQSLSPDGDVAKHVNERIQTLKRILSY